MKQIIYFLALFALPGLLSIDHSARAQTIADSFSGFSKRDNKQPINIEADSLEVLDDKKYALFTGNVKATQGKFQLISKKLKVTYSGGLGAQKKGETPGIKSIDATGKVAISTPDNQSATSDWAKFEVQSRIVTIGGNVVLTQGGNVMRGDKLTIDLNTGRSKFHAASQTTGNATKGKRKRIGVMLVPGKGNKNPFGDATKRKKPVKQSPPASSTEPPLPWQKQ